MKAIRWFLGALLLTALPLAAQERAAEPTDIEGWVERFESYERKTWQGLAHIGRLLAASEGETVVDLGTGTGMMVPFFSSSVGRTGKVYAVDINPEFLAYVDARKDTPFPDRVETILAEPDDPKLPDGEVDAVLIMNTWHHIDDRVAYAKTLRRAMSPYGRVVLVDWRKEELPLGPPQGEKLSREQVIKEFEKGGWRLVTDSSLLRYHYLLTFYPE